MCDCFACSLGFKFDIPFLLSECVRNHVSVNDFDRWLSEASQAAEKTFDPKDTGAQWGWTWKKS